MTHIIYGQRSRFYRNLSRAGLSRGQIQHVQTLYNDGRIADATTYLRKQNVSDYRRRRSRELRIADEILWKEAREAKKRKLGTDRFMENATMAELRKFIELDVEQLREQARSQRHKNPFWYHTRRSYSDRYFSGRAA